VKGEARIAARMPVRGAPKTEKRERPTASPWFESGRACAARTSVRPVAPGDGPLQLAIRASQTVVERQAL